MTTKHDWQETPSIIGASHGFRCSKCDLFFKYNSTRPVDGCEKSYTTMSQQDIRRELSGTEFWNEDKGDR